MQCPSCLNSNLTPSDDGRLVCDDCGEQFAGFQEEQVDFTLAGTAVSTRQSQSSQAQAVRKKLDAKKIASHHALSHPVCATPSYDILLCEGVFILSKNIARKLIELQYVNERIMQPLFHIVTHWVRRRQAGAHLFSKFHRNFQPFHVLSMISLASLYIRCPMLPRDLCRLVATRQIPYIATLKTVFPPHFVKTAAIRDAFTPKEMPIAKHVIRGANVIMRDKFAWYPLRAFFKANDNLLAYDYDRCSSLNDLCLKTKVSTAFPVGHLHITLLRLSRLLGLPDEFGARVLRFIELRTIAVKMARCMNGAKGGPWDTSKMDACSIDWIPSYLDANEPYYKCTPGERDLYGFPSDESVQIDFINTMRLCYSRKRDECKGGQEEVTKRDIQMREEWEGCKDAMERWLKVGNPEDIDNVGWTSLAPNVLCSLRGKQVREYASIVDDMLTERGETVPELWGKFIRAFEDIGAGDMLDSSDDEIDDEEQGDHLRMENRCMYDVSRCKDELLFEAKEGREAMEELYTTECGCQCERRVLRKWGGRTRARKMKECDFMYDPGGIGLAWTIMWRFFNGSNVLISGMDGTIGECSDIHRIRVAGDRSMDVVIRYILGLKALEKKNKVSKQRK